LKNLTQDENRLLVILFGAKETMTWRKIQGVIGYPKGRCLRQLKENLINKGYAIGSDSGKKVDETGAGSNEAGIFLIRNDEQLERAKKQGRAQALKLLVNNATIERNYQESKSKNLFEEVSDV
jgi:hypothetical protein